MVRLLGWGPLPLVIAARGCRTIVRTTEVRMARWCGAHSDHRADEHALQSMPRAAAKSALKANRFQSHREAARRTHWEIALRILVGYEATAHRVGTIHVIGQ